MGIFQRGTRFGSREQYAVQRKLGEGQFAEVYEVRDSSVKDRDQRVSAGWPGALQGVPLPAGRC